MDQLDDQGSAPAFQLADRPKLVSKVFQQHWGSFQFAQTFDVSLSNPLTKESFEQEMLQKSIVTMASGGSGGQLKFFLYAQHVSIFLFLPLFLLSLSLFLLCWLTIFLLFLLPCVLVPSQIPTNLWFLLEAKLSQSTKGGSVTLKTGVIEDAPVEGSTIEQVSHQFIAHFTNGL